MRERILQVPTDGVRRSDTFVKSNAEVHFSTKRLDFSQIKRELLKMGQLDAVFELLPQTEDEWYRHIRQVITEAVLSHSTLELSFKM